MQRVTVPEPLLRQAGEALFVDAGLSPEDAAIVTRVQVEADLRGMHSHGMRAVPAYLNRIALGIINPRPTVRIVHETEISVVIDGDDGPGQVVAYRAMRECIARARRVGIGIAAARRSNHFGAAGYYAMMALEHDLIGFATTTGNVILAPVGSQTPVVGNNPIAYAIPAGEEWPIVLDFGTSVTAEGKIALARAEGETLPEGWALDVPSTSTPIHAPLGFPHAGHKGFGLAVVMEVLAGILAGAKFGRQHALEIEDGERPWDDGHFFVALDPRLLMPIDEFKQRVDRFIRDCRAAPPMTPGGPTPRVPGEEGWRRRERALRDGVPLPASVYRALADLLEKKRLAPRLRIEAYGTEHASDS